MGHRRRRRRDRDPRRAQHRRDPGVRPDQRRPRRGRLRHPGAARAAGLRPRLQPAHARVERPLRRRPDLGSLPARDPRGDDRLHGHRDRLQPLRGGARPLADHPALDLHGGGRRLRDLLHAAADRALGDARPPGQRALRDGARPAAAEGLRERPGARRRLQSRSHGSPAVGDQDLRGNPRRDDPLHRDERRRDRRLADHLFDGRLPAAAERLPPAAPEVQDALAVADHLRRLRLDPRPAPRQDDLPRHDVLVRRDALLHDRARRGDPAAAAARGRGHPVEGPAQLPLARGRLAALRRDRLPRNGPVVARRRDRVSERALCRARLARARVRRLRRLPAAGAAHPPERDGARAGRVREGGGARVPQHPRADRARLPLRRGDGLRLPARGRTASVDRRVHGDPGAARPAARRGAAWRTCRRRTSSSTRRARSATRTA